MANEEHLVILKKGVEKWNQWRAENSDERPDLSGANLRSTDLSGAKLRSANLSDADLSYAVLSEADLSGAQLSSAKLSKANLRGANLSHADVSGAQLSGANLIRANLLGANLKRANLLGAKLSHADLGGVDLSRAHLTGANLFHARLVDADLSFAKLLGAELTDADLSGAKLSAFLTGANLISAKLVRADLGDAHLKGADLSHAKLTDANLMRARLGNADLSYADLSGALLSEANLADADLTGALLSGANLDNAILQKAILIRAVLFGANLSRARFEWTTLADVDLSEARSLEQVLHSAPSSMATDTLTKSKGKIPEVFLRGCGLTDWEIQAAKLWDPDLTRDEKTEIAYEVVNLQAESPMVPHHVFISYSHADSAFVEKLEAGLDDRHIRYWRDVHDMKAGRMEPQIEKAIRVNPLVLLVLSERSVESDWVEWEVSKARELDKKYKRDVLCPIALDDAWKTCDWPGPLRRQVMEYNILDFSDPERFDDQFEKFVGGIVENYPPG